MAENKKKIIVYSDWFTTFDELSNEEAGKLIKHFFMYVNDKNPKSDRLTELLFLPIKATLKRDLEAWEAMRSKRIVAGAKGGKQKVANVASARKRVAKVAVNDSVSVSVSVKEKAIPTQDEFLAFALASKSNVNQDEVKLKYQSWVVNDWSVTRQGKTNPIKNWKSTLLNTIPFFGVVAKEYKSPQDQQFDNIMHKVNEENERQRLKNLKQ